MKDLFGFEPPSRSPQGQSETTNWKEAGFRAAVWLTAKIKANAAVKFSIIAQRPFFLFDLYCGSGHNDQANCDGSPIQALDALREVGLTFCAHFVDRDETAIQRLRHILRNQESVWVHNEDNRVFIPKIPEIIRQFDQGIQYAMGAIILDPNGFELPSGVELEPVTRACPRLDLIIHWNSGVRNRVRRAKETGKVRRADGSNAFSEWEGRLPLILDVPNVYSKRYWWIREPTGRNNHLSTMLVGRNFEIGAWKPMGFHHLDSEMGRQIAYDCDYTKAEKARRGGENQ